MALDDVSFTVNAGDRVGVVGRNGAGKSTLLKVLSRITEPTRGSVQLRGRVASLLEVGTGFHPELTGRENIYLNGSILGMSRKEITAKFDEIVDFAEVERFLDTPVKRYSSGMYVRLAFAVAAHLEPEILVIDEVLAVGDARFQKKCLGKMEDVSKQQGRTVLFVSHNLGVVAQLCNKAIYLKQGQLVAQGDAPDILQQYLADDEGDNVYKARNAGNKEAYTNAARTLNAQNEPSANLKHDDPIKLEIEFQINEFPEGLNLGLAMLDKFKRRVFTINRHLADMGINKAGKHKLILSFPANTFAPNNYSWLIGLNIDGKMPMIDQIDDCCSFTIIDNGSEFAAQEGYDYGHVFMRDYGVQAF